MTSRAVRRSDLFFCPLTTNSGITADSSISFSSGVPTIKACGLELRFFGEALGFAELETGGSALAIAAHSLGEILMPDGYTRPVDGQPAGVEIAFLTRDVSASFAKVIAEELRRLRRRMHWGLEVAYVRAPEGTIIGF